MRDSRERPALNNDLMEIIMPDYMFVACLVVVMAALYRLVCMIYPYPDDDIGSADMETLADMCKRHIMDADPFI